jgi:hypothetical protein
MSLTMCLPKETSNDHSPTMPRRSLDQSATSSNSKSDSCPRLPLRSNTWAKADEKVDSAPRMPLRRIDSTASIFNDPSLLDLSLLLLAATPITPRRKACFSTCGTTQRILMGQLINCNDRLALIAPCA